MSISSSVTCFIAIANDHELPPYITNFCWGYLPIMTGLRPRGCAVEDARGVGMAVSKLRRAAS